MTIETIKPSSIEFNNKTCAVSVRVQTRLWLPDPTFVPSVELPDRVVLFNDARSIVDKLYHTGVADGIVIKYEDFTGIDMVFETIYAIDQTTGGLVCTFVPHRLPDKAKINWPAAFIADDPGSYGVFTNLQGYILPTNWPEEAPMLPFGGQMASCTAYMPWFGMVHPDGAYMCRIMEPWDTAYRIDHPPGGPTRVHVTLLPSLGKLTDQRTCVYTFLPKGADYVSICKCYRNMVKEEGRLVTLAQKALRTPSLNDLIGCAVLHVGIKSHVVPDSTYYNHDDPSRNDSLVTFGERAEQLRQIKAQGVERLYLHLDGWGEPGYDNKHPDYMPPCDDAGGWDGLRQLADTAHELGYLFGIHDQYRDYYLDAPTYDPDNAVKLADGSIYEMCRWAGGKQNYLCSALAPAYVKRSFEQLLEHGVNLDAAYLDVFTCNEPDECANPRHTVTRAQCLAYRAQCFDYLLARGVLPSSEEANDWAIHNLVFCHWAPYAKGGVPVPLWNLVYHDCFLIPWSLGKGAWGTPEGQSGYLHALLNGGIGYLDTEHGDAMFQQTAEQCKVLSELADKVAYQEMVSHEFVGGDYNVQRTVFGDGTQVLVDLGKESSQVTH